MNFKDCYKKANDEIKGDRALLENILNTPVKEKTKITPFVYKFASCAAALILVGTVILMPEIKDKFVTEEEVNAVAESTAKETLEGITADTAEELNEETAVYGETFATDGHAGEKTDTNEKALTKSTVKATEATEDKNMAKEPETEEKANSTVTMNALSDRAAVASEEVPSVAAYSVDAGAVSEEEKSEGAAASEETAPEEEAAPAGKITSGGGAAMMRSTSASGGSAAKAKVYQPSEILKLIEINEGSLTPSKMTLTHSEVGYAEFSSEGNISAYEINLVFEKDGAKIIVLLTDSVTPLALSVTEENGKVSASKTVGNTDIFITAYNITKEETESYINNIA